MNYLFVVMDVPTAEGHISAMTVVDQLLEHRFWAFSETAPVKCKLQPDDHGVIYVGGRERHWFVAECVVGSTLQRATPTQQVVLGKLGLKFMRDVITFSSARRFAEPVPIGPLLAQLDFINDKRNYGLSLRLPLRAISEDDYRTIIQGAP